MEGRPTTLHGASTCVGVHLGASTCRVGCLHGDSMLVSMDVSSGASTGVWEGGSARWKYTVKKVRLFLIPRRDVTNQTLPAWEQLDYFRPGRVW